MMSTLHAIFLGIDLLYLLCSLAWAMRIAPKSATYPALLQLVTITIVQGAIATHVWNPVGPVLLWPVIAHLAGLVTFGLTLFPLTQLFSVLRPKSNIKNFEA